MRWLLLVAFLPLAGASTQAQESTVSPHEVETTLYFHLVRSGLVDFAINTQAPQSMLSPDAGTFSPTLACVARAITERVGQGSLMGLSDSHHTFHGYGSRLIDYDDLENGKPRHHPALGQAAEVAFNGSKAATLHWFLRFDEQLPFIDVPADPGGPLPALVVQATLRAGDGIELGGGYKDGEPVMQGRTEPVVLARGQALTMDGRPSSQVTGEAVADGYVYEFQVPLKVLATLERDKGYAVQVDVFTQAPACDDPAATGSVAPAQMRMVADDRHLPRLVASHAPAMLVQQPAAVEQNLTHGTLVAWEANSVWGNYDVDLGSLGIVVDGPAALPASLAYAVQRPFEHYHLVDPVRIGWALDAADAPDGTYTATVSASNLQGTANVTSTVRFRIEDGRLAAFGANDLAAPPAALALAALASLAVLRRR